VRRGVLLPIFRSQLDDALDLAAQCASLGIDGVFAYDHLYPPKDASRPAFAPLPLLARVAHLHPALMVGTLVARVGMVGADEMVEQFRTLAAVAPGRAIAGLGIGDEIASAELTSWGLPIHTAAERREMLARVLEGLRGVCECWVGGGAPSRDVARQHGAEVNLWEGGAAALDLEAQRGPTNVAGPAPDDLHGHLDAMFRAGATWTIYTPNVDIAALASWEPPKTL